MPLSRSMHSGHTAWYLLQSKPRQTERARENLKNQGFHCFLPMAQIERVQKNKRTFVPEPLFPGYLFIQLNNVTDNWSPIRSTRGVARLVAFNGEPQVVRQEVMDALFQRNEAPLVIETFQPGDAVRITQGPFAHIEAIFQAYSGEERVVLLLKLLNQMQQLQLPRHQVEPLAYPKTA